MFAAHLDELRARARRVLRNDHDADDLVQDVVERALRSGAAPENPRAWLYAILNRLVIDRGRRLRRAPRIASIDPALVVAAANDEAEPWRDVDDEAVRAAVDRLPVELEATWRLRVDEQLDYAQIATLLAIPKGTVGTRLARARELLRELISRRSPG